MYFLLLVVVLETNLIRVVAIRATTFENLVVQVNFWWPEIKKKPFNLFKRKMIKVTHRKHVMFCKQEIERNPTMYAKSIISCNIARFIVQFFQYKV
jgi:hypothetical protein